MAKKTINMIWAALTTNKQTFSEQEIGAGINYKGPVVSNQLNGIATDLYQMLDFEQRTGGFYNPLKKYKTDNIVTILREDVGIGKRIEYFRCKIPEGDEIVGEHPYIQGQYDDNGDIPIMKGGFVNADKWERMNFEVKKDLQSVEITNPLDGSWEEMGKQDTTQGGCSVLKIWEIPKPQPTAVDPVEGKKIYGKYKVELWYEENLYFDGLKNNSFSSEYFGDDAVYKCEFDIEFSGRWRRRVDKDNGNAIDVVQEPGFGPFAMLLNNFTATGANYDWYYPDSWVSNVVAWKMSKPRGRALMAWSEYNWDGTPRKCDGGEPARIIDTQIQSNNGAIYTAVGPTALVPVHDTIGTHGSPALFTPIKYFGLTSTSTALASHIIRRAKYISSNPAGTTALAANPKPWVFRIKKIKVIELAEPEGIRFFDTQLATIDDPWKTLGFYEMGGRFWEMEYPQIGHIVPQARWGAYALDWGSLRVTAGAAVEMDRWRDPNTTNTTAANTQGKMYRWAPLANAASMTNALFNRPNNNGGIIMGWSSYMWDGAQRNFSISTEAGSQTTGRRGPTTWSEAGSGATKQFLTGASFYTSPSAPYIRGVWNPGGSNNYVEAVRYGLSTTRDTITTASAGTRDLGLFGRQTRVYYC